jgi:hypothetical protein
MEDGMKEEKSALETAVDRRRFTLASAMAILSGVAITITETACGGSDSPAGPSPTPTPTPAPNPSPSGDKMGTITANHGHTATISAAELAAGGAINVDIRGTSDHPHTVSLSSADITAIAGGQRVSRESTTDSAHSHTVTFN